MKLYNFLNDDGNKYKELMRSPVFVDKSGLIGVLNDLILQGRHFICNSRPRRFGKSVTCNMLRAYYSKGIDSSTIFDNLQISKHKTYRQFLNKYDVIHIDMAKFVTDPFLDKNNVVDFIATYIINELKDLYPNVSYRTMTLRNVLEDIYTQTGNKFVIIIDEWDIIIREYHNNTALLNKYINFLHSIFKSESTNDCLALAYLTGIMPLDQKTKTLLNNFKEFTMINPSVLSPYFGFTGDEVKSLSKKFECDYNEIKAWYDGYKLEDYDIYNPFAVTNSILDHKFLNYWSATSSYEKINYLIENDFDGTKAAIVNLISGGKISIDISSFNNIIDHCKSKNDVLTLLIYLGYLAYDSSSGYVYIPNNDTRCALINAMHVSKWTMYDDLMVDSSNLMEETFRLNEDFVGKQMKSIELKYQSIIKHNADDFLTSIIELAYLYTLNKYERPIRELQAGKGFSNIIYIPKKIFPKHPALIINMGDCKKKFIKFVNEKKCDKKLKNYVDNMILVYINYNDETKTYACEIEKYIND